MTLMRGRFIGYEYDRMVVLFSMLDGQREVPCAISTSAMDELEGVGAGERASARRNSCGCARAPLIEWARKLERIGLAT